jgi:hypothetical protein
VGGWSGTVSSSGTYSGRPVATAEVYDPSTRAFSTVASLTTARFAHAAVALSDGRVLVLGGSDSLDPSIHTNEPNPLASAELYAPVCTRRPPVAGEFLSAAPFAPGIHS